MNRLWRLGPKMSGSSSGPWLSTLAFSFIVMGLIVVAMEEAYYFGLRMSVVANSIQWPSKKFVCLCNDGYNLMPVNAWH